MRVTTVRIDGRTRAARLDGDQLALLPYGDVAELLATGADWTTAAAERGEDTLALSDADLAPLVPRPEKIFGVGLNYRGHAAEAGLAVLDNPPLFGKFWRSLIGPTDDLVLPANSQMTDWEGELGLVIGTPVRHVGLDEGLAAIAGYTVVNDVSMRDWQRRTSQFLQGKTFEGSTPVGPFLVTPDEIDDPSRLHLTCLVDDVVMQDTWTDDLVFNPAEIVSYISQIITLVPGDLIMTGTPAGVGGARRPQVYLEAGQTLRTVVDGVGELINHCVAPEAS
ncbi:MAG TPA: fumarylacetoacetate hydrolase family protein [Baekduia sp.]|jgi:acylpyruvate hydrolase